MPLGAAICPLRRAVRLVEEILVQKILEASALDELNFR